MEILNLNDICFDQRPEIPLFTDLTQRDTNLKTGPPEKSVNLKEM